MPVAPFVPRLFSHAGKHMPYRLFAPEGASAEHPLPLVVWLHGASGVGTDNRAQIEAGGNEFGSRLWVRPEIQAKYPAFVVAPQSPASELWGNLGSAKVTTFGQLVIDLVDALARELPIDRDRVYLLGQSRGGIGVWDLITKRPEVFAAAVPLCALGDPKRVAAARGVRVWVFHGAKDVMPVGNAREMVAALTAAGGVVRYTEYADLGMRSGRAHSTSRICRPGCSLRSGRRATAMDCAGSQGRPATTASASRSMSAISL
jgi:predicted peptidase